MFNEFFLIYASIFNLLYLELFIPKQIIYFYFNPRFSRRVSSEPNKEGTGQNSENDDGKGWGRD